MNITEQAAKVLAEIDAELAICDKATAGPWYYWDQKGNDLISTGKVEGTLICGLAGFQSKKPEFRFIAASRTVCPKSLRMLKTSIEGWLKLTTRPPGDTPDEVCHTIDGYADDAEEILTALINQWNSK